MKVTREDLPQREVLLNIEVEALDLAPYMDRAYRRLVQRVRVPGFRQGKAPREVLERFVSREALRDEAVDLLIPEVVEQAVQQEHLEQGGAPNVEAVQKEPLVLKATVPLMPKVVLDSYRDIRLPLEMVEVAEEDVQNTLESLRAGLALWAPVERPVALGDQATLDVRATVGSREAANQKGVVYMVALENTNPVPGFAEALVGAQAGDRREFTLAVPEDYADRRLAGYECLFRVTVHQVKERHLPELTDEFAKEVGKDYESLEALKEGVRGDLRTQKELQARLINQEKVVQELLARTQIELSPLLIEHEVAHLLSDEEGALNRQQVSMEEYLRRVGKSQEEHREEARTRAMQRLTRTYALLKVAELEGLAAEPQEVEQEVQMLIEGAGPRAGVLRRNLETAEGRDSLERAVRNRKAMEKLVEIAAGSS